MLVDRFDAVVVLSVIVTCLAAILIGFVAATLLYAPSEVPCKVVALGNDKVWIVCQADTRP